MTPTKMNPAFLRFLHLLKESQHIVITTHIQPDGDGIGSQIGLMLALQTLGKKAYCVNEEAFSSRYDYLDEERQHIMDSERYIKNHSDEAIDLFITVDTHDNRIGSRMLGIKAKASKTFCIDHHPISPEKISKDILIDTSAAATGELIAEIIMHLKIPFTIHMAKPLYTSILLDTSSFRYPTVTAKTHHIISLLIDTGINPARIYDLIYGTKKIGHMHLLGEVLQRSQVTKDGKIAWVIITKEQLEQYQCKEEDTYSFVNYLLVLHGIHIAIMFRSLDQGKVKASFRTTGIIDVEKFAEALGGGGHNHSAAVVLEGNLDSIIKNVLDNTEKYLKSISSQNQLA